MKYSRIFFTGLFLIVPLIIVSPSFSEIKILLKNGRSIIADGCTEVNGKFVCYRMGGTFYIEKNDVSETEGITAEKQYSNDEQTLISEPETKAEREETKKPAADAGDSAKTDAGVLIKGAAPEAEERLDRITERKIDLKTDRDNLIKESEQLHEDVKNTGVVRTQAQFDALKKKIADLQNRINAFNDEVKNLDDEEQKILKELKK